MQNKLIGNQSAYYYIKCIMNMKKLFLTFLLTLTFIIPVRTMSQNKQELPDFRYPETVAKDSQKALDQAIKNRDGHAIVSSLVQFGLAKTSVSRHNMKEVCQKIDEVLSVDGLLTPDIRSLVYLLQARIVADAPSDVENPYDNLRDLWFRALDPKCVGDMSALQRPLSEYNDLITPGSEIGNRAIPTLLDFVTMQVAERTYFPYEERQTWLSRHLADTDILPTLYIEQYIAHSSLSSPWDHYSLSKEDRELYKKYASHPESALFLLSHYTEDQDYELNKDYLDRYPEGLFSGKIQHQIAQLEDREVSVSYPSLLQSTDGITVSVTSRNVNDVTLSLYRLPKKPEERSMVEMQVSDFVLVQTLTVHADGKVPFRAEELTATFNAVPCGQYIILPSYAIPSGTHRDSKVREDLVHSHMLSVSDIRTFRIRPKKMEVRDNKDYAVAQPMQIFAVNSQSGQPIADATVEYAAERGYSQKKNFENFKTNRDGYVTVNKQGVMTYRVSKNDDSYLPEYSEYYGSSEDSYHHCGLSVFTDLGIYRPGEEIRLSIVAWEAGFNHRQPTPSLDLKIRFKDASGNDIATKEVTTDAMGQVVTSFQIPTDRMNGSFSFRISSDNNRYSYSATKYVDVSEYKTPTFFVSFSDTKPNQLAGESAKIIGYVKTYSGMPVADADVECTLSARPWMWWYDDVYYNAHHFTVKTDREGRFEYSCPKEWTEMAQSSNGRRPYMTYTIHGTCTNAAGETHEGQQDFWIGKSRGLSCYDETLLLKKGEKANYYISLHSSDSEETAVKCHYSLSKISDKDTVLVMEEDFMSDKQEFHWDQVPSGEYQIKAYIVGDQEAEPASANIVLYREEDALPPVKSSLWLSHSSQYIDEDGHIRVLLGTSTGSWIYSVVSSRNRIESSQWQYFKPGLHWVTAEMPKALDEEINMSFYTIREGESFSANASFRSPWKNEANLSAVSFRDKIQPGQTEHWTFRITDQQGNPIPGSRMMLELYNDALHSLSPNNWSLGTMTYGSSLHSYRTPSYGSTSTELQYLIPRANAKSVLINLPQTNLYGHSFYRSVMIRNYNSTRGGAYNMVVEEMDMVEAMPMAMASAPRMEAKAAVMNNAMEEEADGAKKPSMSDVAVRAEEVKVALWEPQLVADADGVFTVEFDAPNFNTTYQFQAVAYSPSLQSDYIRKKVLAQRPVMVQASLPRFLRSGDSIVLSANVMNATDSVLSADALIELFDPRTNEVVQSERTQLTLQAHGTEVVRINYSAPHDAPYIGFRIKALAADGNGDGEQQLLPIISDITPVIETQPFYLQPQTSQFSIDIDAPALANGNARLTLEYCNNPTWYCVTALPSIIDADAITSPALAHNLFALSLTGKLASENPMLAKAITSWKERQGTDYDVLKSPLQQNEDLKINPLLASPWLPEAERQTMRMQALDQLFDMKRNQKLTDKLINSLQKLQAKDGGFLWLDFDDDRKEASYWATSVVLELLGEIHHLGCLPDDASLRVLINEATHYYDKATLKAEKEMLADAKKYGYKPTYLRFWSYAYTRQLLSSFVGYESRTISKEVMSLIDKTLKELEKDWGSLDMTSRARAAVTLQRYGRSSKAQGVMESVRQFALHDPHKGMYWESLEYSGFSPVACTSAMLQAFAEVSPRESEINEMREWLLLEKQTSDWGSSSMAIDAVYSILSTGSDWLHASVDSLPQFDILVDGKPVDVSETDRYLGYVRMSLPADAKKVEFSRSGVNPAWGSLYHQYQAAMTDVKAQRVDELAITKQIARIDAEGKIQKLAVGDSLHVGDRIRTILHINAAKDLEYVTLIDQRPAFLEPVDQKSHYSRNNRFYYYLEVKDTATNAFVQRLPEGNYDITYDCFVTASGTFTSGIATIQSQYAPQFVAHSAGDKLSVK